MSSRLLRGLGTRQFGDGQFLAVHGGKGFVAAELEHDPILEDFPEDDAALLLSLLVGPDSGEARDLAVDRLVVEMLEPGGSHGRVDVGGQAHRASVSGSLAQFKARALRGSSNTSATPRCPSGRGRGSR